MSKEEEEEGGESLKVKKVEIMIKKNKATRRNINQRNGR